MKLTALVVTYNDDKHLEECLRPLSKFDELIVVDLGSEDSSVEIARSYCKKVYFRSWVPAVELIMSDIIESTTNDWIIRLDPDEVIPPNLVDQLLQFDVDDTIGLVTIPYKYYFNQKELNTTIWGGIKYGRRVFNKKRTNIDGFVHRTHECINGYREFQIYKTEKNVVAHYWVDSYLELLSKHERYLKLEGKSRYNRGDRYSTWKMFIESLLNLKIGLLDKSGWRGGWDGWFLSFFYALYTARSWLSLRKFELSIHEDGIVD